MISRYESFTACISSLYHAIQKIERAEMEAFGLKGPHAHCLLVISRHPEGLTAARLCELCEKDKAAVSRILSELVREGMVSRECRNGTRYRALLKLTEKASMPPVPSMKKPGLQWSGPAVKWTMSSGNFFTGCFPPSLKI